MAEVDDIQPLVCDNGTGIVKVRIVFLGALFIFSAKLVYMVFLCIILGFLVMMLQGPCFPALWDVHATLV
ncbi:hypothetical protein SLE2022_283570 [Rubroshorea leprosula]